MRPKPTATLALPSQPFFETQAQRVALARQRFFDEGQRPSGLVGEHVIQSWSRCTHAHLDPQRALEFDPVSVSRLHATLGRNRELLEVARAELTQLEAALAGTRCRALLADRDGVIVHSTQGRATPNEQLLPVAARIGVNLSETRVGTTAPGIVLKTGNACSVMGSEHFFHCVQVMHCAAAPIHDRHGRLAGVLDLTIESQPFGFDAASLVGLYATAIEGRLLQAQSDNHLVLQFQASPALLGTPLEALAGIGDDGRVAWMNRAARRLLGAADRADDGDAETLFGLDLHGLLALTRRESAGLLQLPSGLSVWLRARLQARDGGASAATVLHDATVAESPVPLAVAAETEPDGTPGAEPPLAPATLDSQHRALIDRTLSACDGNVSRAARTLGVSRGLLYRHLRQRAATDEGASAGDR